MIGCNAVAVDCSHSRIHHERAAVVDDDVVVNRSIPTELGSTRTCHHRRRGHRRHDPTVPLVSVGTEVSRSVIRDGVLFAVVWML